MFSPRSLAQAGCFDAQAVQRLVAKCRAGAVMGTGDNMAFVGILSTQLLDSLFVRGAAASLHDSAEPAVV
jgi:asparagine synthase (glutamine-hydrolysing)